MSGHSHISLNVSENCCDINKHESHCETILSECCRVPASTEAFGNQECCEDQFIYVRLDFDLQNTKVLKHHRPLLPEITIQEDQLTAQIEAVLEAMAVYLDLPPPIHGRELILFIQQPKVPVPA
jgi:hypothetical protein